MATLKSILVQTSGSVNLRSGTCALNPTISSESPIVRPIEFVPLFVKKHALEGLFNVHIDPTIVLQHVLDRTKRHNHFVEA